MRYYRLALTIGIISAMLVLSSFAYYIHAAREINFNRTKLERILATIEQRKQYVKKIESIKAYSAKLVNLSHQRGINVDYEITLTDHDVKKLFSEVASTYAEDMFFLEKAIVTSTSSGITVSMKGFKLGGGN
jgi:acetolactate synthase regulatory subunit